MDGLTKEQTMEGRKEQTTQLTNQLRKDVRKGQKNRKNKRRKWGTKEGRGWREEEEQELYQRCHSQPHIKSESTCLFKKEVTHVTIPNMAV